MTTIDQQLLDIVKKARTKDHKDFIWTVARRVDRVIELKNPLCGTILVDEIEDIIEIVNPRLKKAVAWLKEVQEALKQWVNEKIITNRILGIKNDNEYDLSVFEKAVLQRFLLSEKPKPEALIQTDFKTIVEMVEMGARRFGDK